MLARLLARLLGPNTEVSGTADLVRRSLELVELVEGLAFLVELWDGGVG